MKTKRVNISLPLKTLERLNSSIPEGSRSRYIAQALDEKLQAKSHLKESIIRDLKENRWIHEEAMREWEGTKTPWPKS